MDDHAKMTQERVEPDPVQTAVEPRVCCRAEKR